MNRYRSYGRNTGIGTLLVTAAGLVAAMAAFGSQNRRSLMVQARQRHRDDGDHRFGGHNDERDERNRRGGIGRYDQDREYGQGRERRGWSDQGRDGRHSGDQDRSRMGGQDPVLASEGGYQSPRGVGGYDQSGRDENRDYRGGGYGSDFARAGQGGYDRDNDYRRGFGGGYEGGRGMGGTQGDFGGGPDYSRRGGSGGQRFSGGGDGSSGGLDGSGAGGYRTGHEGYGSMQRGEHRGKGPKGYARSDERIREEVCDYLSDDPHIDASEIEVSVNNGEVTLSGSVNDRNAKRHAEDIIEHLTGVKNVQNNLRVSQGGSMSGQGGSSGPVGSTTGGAGHAGATPTPGSQGTAGTTSAGGAAGQPGTSETKVG
jgi:BON domain